MTSASPRAVTTATLHRVLRRRFGLDELRPGQEEVIRNVVAGRDTLAVLPTGAGKSLCYQLPALLLPGATVVVSPLIALMNDQAEKLDRAGVDTARMNSTLKRSDESEALDDIEEQEKEIVFVTPERLNDGETLQRLSQNHIDMLVVDEAHCISQWGHDFRPAFLEIANALPALGDPPVLALTATATAAVIDDIRRQLRRPEMRVVNASIYRPNLRYEVRQETGEEAKRAALRRLLDEVPGTVIVYTATVRSAVELHRTLARGERPALLYHGQLRAGERQDSQQRFMSENGAIMVATNAFGLGIDKPDVRAVVHWQMPASLETYYQESGRAGRDAEPARCVLLFDQADLRIQRFFMAGRYPHADDIEAVWRALQIPETVPTPAGIATAAALSESKTRVALKALADAGLVQSDNLEYRPASSSLDAQAVDAVAEQYRSRAQQDQTRLDQLMAYAHSARCRWLMLLEYFGETPEWTRCGRCDNCLHPPEIGAPVRRKAMPPPASRTEAGLEPGQQVRVPRLGNGTITEVRGEAITIVFPDGRRRNFLRSYVTPGTREQNLDTKS
jgi:ATP-dependent DNA helicase RecQ